MFRKLILPAATAAAALIGMAPGAASAASYFSLSIGTPYYGGYYEPSYYYGPSYYDGYYSRPYYGRSYYYSDRRGWNDHRRWDRDDRRGWSHDRGEHRGWRHHDRDDD